MFSLLFVGAAAFAIPKSQEDVVLGASLTWNLGDVGGASRLGASLDVGYHFQRYFEHGEPYQDGYAVWAEESLSPNYGATARIGWHARAWRVSLGARGGLAWPLRVGLGDGWYPGPGLLAEAGVAISSAGYQGIDLQALVDLPWVEGRVGTTLTGRGWRDPRVGVGLFTPWNAPENWEGLPSYWDRPTP